MYLMASRCLTPKKNLSPSKQRWRIPSGRPIPVNIYILSFNFFLKQSKG